MCALSFGYCNQSQRIFLRNANNFNDIIYKGNRGKIRVSQNPEPLRGAKSQTASITEQHVKKS
ncbi:hypothetical protein DFZ14_21365 [Escherichia coli]|nr:hypothetical protein [Escherichia coli]EEZ0151816.1 hypothetical protein [Escherichia coli]EFB4766664.1 hypothetical protein [Escherichia coli]MHV44061.1 hypothetical protein [Escherichia coli]